MRSVDHNVIVLPATGRRRTCPTWP